MNHVFNDITGRSETPATLLTGDKAIAWNILLANEWVRLSKSIKNRVIVTDTIDFIHKSEVPHKRKVTYGNFVCDYRPLKTEQWRVQLTVRGDCHEYPHEAASPAVSLIENKLIINTTISDAHKDARVMVVDLMDFSLKPPMERPEFMKIHQRLFPIEILEAYKLHDKITKDGYIYIRIKHGMYDLKKAARLAYDLLCK